MFGGAYKNKRVLVTGHTGFKGSWLTLWLYKLGAEVCGFSLGPASTPNHLDRLDLKISAVTGDIRDPERVRACLRQFEPQIVFHLAAQAIVRRSYKDPAETFSTNVMGLVNLLESCRNLDGLRAIVNVTSDKCYENREWFWPYRENDPLGGADPYSASKACAELVTQCYRSAFFPLESYGKAHRVLVCTTRAGNVIGGGDWGEDRLVPDMVRAALGRKTLVIRNPNAVRPWQHVLEPLTGYLLLGQSLLAGKADISGSYNFGPGEKDHVTVMDVVKGFKDLWDGFRYEIRSGSSPAKETGMLRLDCSNARRRLRWEPLWTISKAIRETVDWYRDFYESGRALTVEQLEAYVRDAGKTGAAWVI